MLRVAGNLILSTQKVNYSRTYNAIYIAIFPAPFAGGGTAAKAETAFLHFVPQNAVRKGPPFANCKGSHSAPGHGAKALHPQPLGLQTPARMTFRQAQGPAQFWLVGVANEKGRRDKASWLSQDGRPPVVDSKTRVDCWSANGCGNLQKTNHCQTFPRLAPAAKGTTERRPPARRRSMFQCGHMHVC
jgi:hypothetical protein